MTSTAACSCHGVEFEYIQFFRFSLSFSYPHRNGSGTDGHFKSLLEKYISNTYYQGLDMSTINIENS